MDNSDFLEDIYPHNLLYALTIRSPAAKGHLILIDHPNLPQYYTLITARNIPGENILEDTDIPILADTHISYIGEPVALLLGPDKTKLVEISSLFSIIIDEDEAGLLNPAPEKEIKREIKLGDTQIALESSGKIVTGSYITGIQDHWYAEPAGAVTYYKSESGSEENKETSAAVAAAAAAAVEHKEVKETKNKKHEKHLIIRTATQWPYHVKRSIVRMLGIDPAAVSVEPTQLNLHVDGKLFFPSHIACHAALGTYITKKPVRLILNREEDFLYSPKRCKSNIDIASTIDDNGNILATEIDISVNLGAYAVNGEEILDQACLGSFGCYNFDNLSLNARALKTNIPPQGPFCGFGLAQGFFAIERHVSQIADIVGQDPALWRKAHINPRLVLPSPASTKNLIPINELIDATVKMSDYSRKWSSYELLRQSRKGKSFAGEKIENPRGIGIALGFQGNGLLYQGQDRGSYSVEVTLTKESILEIKTSITSSDDDFSKIWAKVAAEIMSIEPEMIKVKTILVPDCGPSCGSRNISVLTKLVKKCCLAIRKQRFHDPLPITVRRTVKPTGGALWDGRFPAQQGKILDINSFSKPGLAAAVVEVSIDLIECIPKIRGIWLGIDGGNVISKNRARRSLTRSAAQAIGWAFTENIEYENGILPKSQFNNYSIPSPVDIPSIKVNFLPSDCEDHKGIGELPFNCIPAAFLQAVSQAMDHSFKSIPIKRSEIWEIVRFRNNESHTQGSK